MMRKIAYRALATALLICVLLVLEGTARDLPLALVALTSPVHPGRDARLTVQTAPGTQCMLLVRYKAGSAETELALPRRADTTGRVRWTWRIDPKATPGTWPILVHCSDEFKGSVEQRRLELPFVVR